MNIRLGLFDSGVGGFSILQKINDRFGDIPCVYLGDTARLPYGKKSVNEMRDIAKEVTNWLMKQNISAIVIGCNTTNSLALDVVKTFSEVPVFDLISAASNMTFEKEIIGVLATEATVASKVYSKKIYGLHPGVNVIEQACPEFVPMIETGQFNNDELKEIARGYLKPLLDAKVQSIILGCSHYPLLKLLLKELLPENVRLIDPAFGVAKSLDKFLMKKTFRSNPDGAFRNTRFCVTSDPLGFAASAFHWLGEAPEVDLVSLRSKACVF